MNTATKAPASRNYTHTSPVLHPTASHRRTMKVLAALTGLRPRLPHRLPAEQVPREASQAGPQSKAFRLLPCSGSLQGKLLSPLLPRKIGHYVKEPLYGRQSRQWNLLKLCSPRIPFWSTTRTTTSLCLPQPFSIGLRGPLSIPNREAWLRNEDAARESCAVQRHLRGRVVHSSQEHVRRSQPAHSL